MPAAHENPRPGRSASRTRPGIASSSTSTATTTGTTTASVKTVPGGPTSTRPSRSHSRHTSTVTAATASSTARTVAPRASSLLRHRTSSSSVATQAGLPSSGVGGQGSVRQPSARVRAQRQTSGSRPPVSSLSSLSSAAARPGATARPTGSARPPTVRSVPVVAIPSQQTRSRTSSRSTSSTFSSRAASRTASKPGRGATAGVGDPPSTMQSHSRTNPKQSSEAGSTKTGASTAAPKSTVTATPAPAPSSAVPPSFSSAAFETPPAQISQPPTTTTAIPNPAFITPVQDDRGYSGRPGPDGRSDRRFSDQMSDSSDTFAPITTPTAAVSTLAPAGTRQLNRRPAERRSDDLDEDPKTDGSDATSEPLKPNHVHSVKERNESGGPEDEQARMRPPPPPSELWLANKDFWEQPKSSSIIGTVAAITKSRSGEDVDQATRARYGRRQVVQPDENRLRFEQAAVVAAVTAAAQASSDGADTEIVDPNGEFRVPELWTDGDFADVSTVRMPPPGGVRKARIRSSLGDEDELQLDPEADREAYMAVIDNFNAGQFKGTIKELESALLSSARSKVAMLEDDNWIFEGD